MDSDPRELELESRIRHMEREMASLSAILTRNTEIVDDIRANLNRPVNWPSWIGVGIGLSSILSGILYATLIQPVALKVEFQQEILESLNARHAEIDKRFDANKDIMMRILNRDATNASNADNNTR